MNDQSTLLAYLAFICLQRLMPKAQLLAVYPQTPYTTLLLELPFELQDSFVSVLKENLRGVIKKKSYQIFEMMPQVALSYAASKKIKLSVDEDKPLVVILETDGSMIEIQEGIENQDSELSAHFDLFQIQKVKSETYLSLVFGDETKSLKKQGQLASEFKIVSFLQEAGVLSASGTFLDRGLSLLEYYESLICKPFYAIGCHRESGQGYSENYIMGKSSGEGYEDAILCPGLSITESLIVLSLPLSLKKVNSCLKQLSQVLNLINVKFEIELYGKYSDHDFRELSLGLNDFKQFPAGPKRLIINLIDLYGRYAPIVSFNFARKELTCEIDLVRIVLGFILESKKLYPDKLPRPPQKAILGDITRCPLLLDALFEAQLMGQNAFFLKKDTISDKEALDYQIDDLIYYSESEGVIKRRSFC